VGLGALASALDGTVVAPVNGSGLGLVNDLGYADTIRRGYLLMTATNDDMKGEYVFVDTVKSTTYAASVGKTVTVTAAGGVTYK
jgi:alkaline phosphatase D